MSFDEEYMHGYTAHEKHFNKMAEKASSVMGDITQCVMFEFDNTGRAYLAANRPDFGESFIEKKMYKEHEMIAYGSAVDNKIKPFFSSPCQTLMLDGNTSLFGDKFADKKHGFFYTEKLTDSDAFRMYSFSSDSTKIYDALLNNYSLVKKFIEFFTKESQEVINYYRGRKFDLASQRDDYFKKPTLQIKSKRESFMDMLHSFNILESDINITNREWQCLQLYCQGKSADQTGKVLGISRRTVETHFDRLKSKLGVVSKSELMEYLN